METKLTNRDEVAGLPALSVAEFFSQCDAQVTAKEIATWFRLDGKEEDGAIERLVDEGYLIRESPQATEFIKTKQALAIEQSAPTATLEVSDLRSVVLALLEAVHEVNSSPATAHRVRATTFFGAAINGSFESKALVEALIDVEPFSFEPTLQAELERLALDEATKNALPPKRHDDPHVASIQLIKDRLLSANERLSLRFIIG